MPTSPRLAFGRPALARTVFLCLLAMLAPRALRAAESRTGEQIYRQQCASCHGTAGEGTRENYPKPRAGNRSVTQLARLIARTMPKDTEEKCEGEDARKVAAYI